MRYHTDRRLVVHQGSGNPAAPHEESESYAQQAALEAAKARHPSNASRT